MDHEFSAGELNAGKHHLKITFKNDYENAVGFVIQQLDLVEQGNHEFELIAAPEFVPAGEECKILLKCKKDGVTVSDGKKQYPAL